MGLGLQAKIPYSSIPLDFGPDQVILVRSQEDKDAVRSLFKQFEKEQGQTLTHTTHTKSKLSSSTSIISQNFVCLTVAESKGLEFNDVIIWNYFNS